MRPNIKDQLLHERADSPENCDWNDFASLQLQCSSILKSIHYYAVSYFEPDPVGTIVVIHAFSLYFNALYSSLLYQ